MTKKEATLDLTYNTKEVANISVKQLLSELAPIKQLARHYSELLEEEVSPIRALHLTNAQLSIISFILLCEAPLLVTLGIGAWMALSVWGAAKAK